MPRDTSTPEDASTPPTCDERVLEIELVPGPRVQMTMWLETEDGTRSRTVMLTQSVGRYGIGNRPGASQMNSGYRWPYGRRESVLPYWAHRRVDAGGAPSVVFRAAVDLEHRDVGVITRAPIGRTEPDGRDGELRPMGPEMTDDPVGAPGSGADRLLAMPDGARLRVRACR